MPFIYIKHFYLGHLLVSNFFSPHSRSCCKHFSSKVQSVCANMTVILTMGREGGRGKSFLIFIKNDSAAFFIFSLSAFPKAMRFQRSCSDSSWEVSLLWINLLPKGVGHFEYLLLICGRFMWQTKIKAKLGERNVHGSCFQVFLMWELWRKIH